MNNLIYNNIQMTNLRNDIHNVIKDLNLIYHNIQMNLNKDKELYNSNVINKNIDEKKPEPEIKIKTKINNLSLELENKIDEPFIKKDVPKELKKRGRKKKVVIIDEDTNNILKDVDYDSLIDNGIINI